MTSIHKLSIKDIRKTIGCFPDANIDSGFKKSVSFQANFVSSEAIVECQWVMRGVFGWFCCFLTNQPALPCLRGSFFFIQGNRMKFSNIKIKGKRLKALYIPAQGNALCKMRTHEAAP
jgi:hypothetical protein